MIADLLKIFHFFYINDRYSYDIVNINSISISIQYQYQYQYIIYNKNAPSTLRIKANQISKFLLPFQDSAISIITNHKKYHY